MSDPIDRTLEQLNAGHAVIVPVNELARLRRMADKLAVYAIQKRRYPHVSGGMTVGFVCEGCRAHGGMIKENLIHTATCDVAAHLGLPREKGEGE